MASIGVILTTHRLLPTAGFYGFKLSMMFSLIVLIPKHIGGMTEHLRRCPSRPNFHVTGTQARDQMASFAGALVRLYGLFKPFGLRPLDDCVLTETFALSIRGTGAG